jgi:ADP-ribose pyrophosphatase YjhB (NUDIX family)
MKKTLTSRLRATIRGFWWKEQQKQIRHCFQCGATLKTKYVREEGKHRRVCSKCVAITYTNPKVVAGCIPVMPDGRIVLLKRTIEPARGKWSYPAGYMEMGETVAQAAARETHEEVCARVKVGKQVGVYSYADAGVVTIIFEGRVPRGEKPCAGSECDEVIFVKPKDIPWKKLAFRSTVDALKDWVKNA